MPCCWVTKETDLSLRKNRELAVQASDNVVVMVRLPATQPLKAEPGLGQRKEQELALVIARGGVNENFGSTH